MNREDYITTKEAAAMLTVSDQQIRNWCKNGCFSWIGSGKTTFLIKKDEFDRFVDSIAHNYLHLEQQWDMMLEDKADHIMELEEELNKLVVQKEIAKCKRIINYTMWKEPYMRSFLLDIIKSATHDYDSHITERERYIMESIVKGSNINTVGDLTGLTRERIRQIFGKGVAKVKETALQMPYIAAENKKLLRTLVVQRSHIKELESEVAMLRKMKDVKKKRVENKNKARHWTMAIVLKEYNLPIRALNCLKDANIETLWDLLCVSEFDLLKMRNMGRKTLSELKDFASSLGVRIGQYRETEI